MPKRRGRGSIAVDWTCLPSQVLRLICDLLKRGDIKSASLSCKSWRQALRPLVLKRLHLVLSDIAIGAAAARTRRNQRLPDLQKLLQDAEHGSTVALLLSERRWPGRAQVDALCRAISHQPGVRHLCLRLLEEHGPPPRTDDWFSISEVVKTLCSALATDAQHVSGLTMQTCPLHPATQQRISAALAQLPSLQHLTYSPSSLDPAAITPLTALTTLTSLSLGPLPDGASAAFTLAQQLQLLSKLSLLQSLTLNVSMPSELEAASVVNLPSWPHLRHLHLTSEDGIYLHHLQLSAEHCARLESLTAQCFHAAEGVTSMAQLTQLDVMCSPCKPAAAAQPNLLQEIGQHVEENLAELAQLQQQLVGQQEHHAQQLAQQQVAAMQQQAEQQLQQYQQLLAQQQEQQPQPQYLSFPQLQRLVLGRLFSTDTPAVVARMLSDAPALQELDLRKMSRPLQTLELLAVKQHLSKLRPLRSLKLSAYASNPAQPAQQAHMAQQHILEPAVEAGKLQRLDLSSYQLDAQLCLQLQALASLRELELSCSSHAAAAAEPLAHLPPQLTALTVWGSPSKAQAATVKAPPLRSLIVHSSSPGPVLRLLQLSQLTGLTSLSVGSEMGAATGACISRLTRLVELQAPVWPGMAQQLAGLQQLRSVKLNVRGQELLYVLEGQMVQMGRLTQLRELELDSRSEGAMVKQLAQRLATMLPQCIVVRALSLRDRHGMPWAWPLAKGV